MEDLPKFNSRRRESTAGVVIPCHSIRPHLPESFKLRGFNVANERERVCGADLVVADQLTALEFDHDGHQTFSASGTPLGRIGAIE